MEEITAPRFCVFCSIKASARPLAVRGLPRGGDSGRMGIPHFAYENRQKRIFKMPAIVGQVSFPIGKARLCRQGRLAKGALAWYNSRRAAIIPYLMAFASPLAGQPAKPPNYTIHAARPWYNRAAGRLLYPILRRSPRPSRGNRRNRPLYHSRCASMVCYARLAGQGRRQRGRA